MNTPFGKNIKLYIEGASRDPEISAVLCGLPAGFRPDTEDLQSFMNRRAPGRNPWSTSRREADIPNLSGGIADGICNGKPVKIVIKNNDGAKSDALDYRIIPRPSHADYAALIKYGESVDLRGGGHFSGRLTAPLCAAGRLCAQLLKQHNIEIFARIDSLNGIRDTAMPYDKPRIEELREIAFKDFPVLSDEAAMKMTDCIAQAWSSGDSVGGTVECFVTGLPAGLGEHMFSSVESAICQAVMAIPGVKGIEFGAGFDSCILNGYENNDPYYYDGGEVYIKGNRAGGVTGGMTNGAPLVFRVAFKPTPSVSIEQHTVNLQTKQDCTVKVTGRNDPCYVPRAVPAVEAAAALAIYDLWLSGNTYRGTAPDFRRDIDTCDSEIADAYSRRCEAVLELGKLKKNGKIYIPAREKQVLCNTAAFSTDKAARSMSEIYKEIFRQSRQAQTDMALRAFGGFEKKKIYLIGKPLGHSHSPLLHNLMADYSYECLELDKNELASFFEKRDFDGLNVTIPYKKDVIQYLDYISEEAAAAGAVNTVIKDDAGKLFGFNTDIYGFCACFDKLSEKVTLSRAVILGNGGAARGVREALRILGINDIISVSRCDPGTVSFGELTPELLEGALLVNCTPCGLYPDYAGFPFELTLIKNCAAVIDLVYNPLRTELYLAAEKAGIPVLGGLYMLVCQAVKAAEIFTGADCSTEVCEKVYSELLKRTANTVLVGMPGCGKSSVGKKIAEITGRRFFDTDTDVQERTGYTPCAYITRFGEAAFRAEESISVKTASHLHGAVIATGGGAVLSEENRQLLRSCGKVFFLERDINELPLKSRPLSEKAGLQKMYEKRLSLYLECADMTVLPDTVEGQAEKILTEGDVF